MYNGIGLTTARGTGTSGHVQRNVAALRGPHRRSGKSNKVQTVRRKLAETRTGNAAILAHERRRNVEVAVAELEEELQARGYDDATISSMTDRLRDDLLTRDSKEQAARTLDRELEARKDGLGAVRLSQVHQVAEITGLRNDKLKNAFNVPDDYAEGSVFKKIPDKANAEKDVAVVGNKVETAPQAKAIDSQNPNPAPEPVPQSPSSSSSSTLSSSSSEAAVPEAIIADPPVPNDESASILAEANDKKRPRGGDELLENVLLKRTKTDPAVPRQSESCEKADTSYGRKERSESSRRSPPLSRRSGDYSRRSRSSLDESRDNHRRRRTSVSPGRYDRTPRDTRRGYERWRSPSLPSPRRGRTRDRESPVRWNRRSHRRYNSISSSDSWSSRSVSPRRRRSRSPASRREWKGRRASNSHRDRYYRSRSRSLSCSDSYEWASPPRSRRRASSRERQYSRDLSFSPQPRWELRGRYRNYDAPRRTFNEGRASGRRDDPWDSEDGQKSPHYNGRRNYRDDRSVSPSRFHSPDRSRRYDGGEEFQGKSSRSRRRSLTPVRGAYR